MNNKINFQRIATITMIISLFVIYTLLWFRMIITKSERDGSDFMGLYSAAVISREYGFPEIYDADRQIKVQSDTVGFQFHPDQTSYFTHPPFVILLVNLITDNTYLGSLVNWSIFLILLNGLVTYVFIQSVSNCNFSAGETWGLTFGVFLFWPTFSGLMNGQDALLLLVGTSAWMLQLLTGNEMKAGLWLGLSAIRPQTAIFLAMPFLVRKQKVLLGFAVGAGILALVSLILIGLDGLHKYMSILAVVEGEMWRLPHAKDMSTISGFIRRNFEEVDKGTFGKIIWGGFILGLIAISSWWRKIIEINEKNIGLLVIAALIFVPYAHYHELALLLIPIFCLIRLFHKRELVSNQILCLLPLVISMILMIGFIGGGALKYTAVYLVMFVLGYFLAFPEKIKVLSLSSK